MVKLMGDGALVEFASVVDAVECAAEIQSGIAKRQAELPEDQRIAFRIGINIGDIIIEDDDIYGDGVNVAARLEALAEPGGICVSRTVFDHVRNKVEFGFEPQGEHVVKNIPEPVTVYRVSLDPSPVPKAAGLRRARKGREVALVITTLALLTAAGVAAWLQPWQRSAEVPVETDAPPLPDKPSIAVLPFEHRLTRFTYGAMTGYAHMVHEAHAAWDRLWADLGRSHFQPTGTLVVARADGGWAGASMRCLEAMALPAETWSREALAGRLPFLRFEHARFALFTPTGGVLFAARILEDLCSWLRQHEVALHPHRQVTEIDVERAAIHTAAGGADRGDALVLAAGPWSPDLVPALRGRVTPSRQVALYLEPPPERLPAWRAAPMVLDQIEAARGGFYAVPPVDGTRLKVEDHGFSLRGHPDLERAATDSDRGAHRSSSEEPAGRFRALPRA